MNINKQLTLGLLTMLIGYLSIIGVMNGVKEAHLRRNERRRRAKGQTFKERFLFTRYRDQIPRCLMWFYYLVLIIHPVSLVIILCAFYFVSMQHYTEIMAKVVLTFDFVWMFIFTILGWKPGDPWLHYEKWVPEPPKRKKKK